MYFKRLIGMRNFKISLSLKIYLSFFPDKTNRIS